MRLPIVCAVSACLLLSAAPALGGNFEFVVAAEAGLDMRITGYSRDGALMFEDSAPASETREGAHAYVIRVDETILVNGRLGAWCVEDRSGKWKAASAAGVMVCDDRPSETRGSYRFTARSERPSDGGAGGGSAGEAIEVEAVAPQPSPRVLVACIQTELGYKGFDAGSADGQMGAKTRRAAEAYLAAAPGAGLAPLAENNLAQWCDTLAVRDGKVAAVEIHGDTGALAGRSEALVRAVQDSISRVFESPPIETITYYVSADAAWLTDKYVAANRLGASARPGKLESFGACDPIAEFAYRSVYICAGHPRWASSPGFQFLVFAHEFFHALSGDLARKLGERACCYDLSRMGPLGPEWLKEGGAQYAAFAATEALGGVVLDEVMGKIAVDLAGVNLDLEGRNSRDGYNRLGRDKSELVGMLATHLLTERAGRKALPDYYRYLGYGVGHEEAFKSAFGLSIAEFQPMLDAVVAAR